MKRVMALSFALAVAGCASAPQPAPSPEALDIGPRPSDQEAEAAVRSFFSSTLKDPDSVKQFRFTQGAIRATWYRGLLRGGDYDSGWLVCFEYNAKNSYGGYVGLKKDALMLRRSYTGSFFHLRDVSWPLVSPPCP